MVKTHFKHLMCIFLLFSIVLFISVQAFAWKESGNTRQLAGDKGSKTSVQFSIPPDTKYLIIYTSGGVEGHSDNVDIYVGFWFKPTTEMYTYSSTKGGKEEVIRVKNPPSGSCWVLIYAKSDYSYITLKWSLEG